MIDSVKSFLETKKDTASKFMQIKGFSNVLYHFKESLVSWMATSESVLILVETI